jgi:hypothetical protein
LEVKPYRENIVTVEAMFIGYTEALNRLQEASLHRDPVSTYVPLFEALNWATALDERVRAHWTPDGTPIGYDWRNRILHADLMGGVIFVRNSVHHDWSEAVVLRDHGMTFPLSFPMSFTSGTGKPWQWYWRHADEFPPPSKKQRAGNEQVYRNQMQGREVKHLLDVLGGVFFTLKELLEPHTIPRGDWSDVPLAYDEAQAEDNFPRASASGPTAT